MRGRTHTLWGAAVAIGFLLVGSTVAHGQRLPRAPESTWTKINETCIQLRTKVQPSMIEPLRRVGQRFCQLRGSNTSWRIIGGGSRSLDLALRLFIRRCLHRPDCTIPTGSVGLRNQRHVIRVGGNWVPAAASMRNERDENRLVAHFTPLADVRYSAHVSGLAIDMWCNINPRQRNNPFVVRCQLALEQAFKSAGFCRLKHEWWHFELTSQRVSRTTCDPNWTIGRVVPNLTKKSLPPAQRNAVVDYAGRCANGTARIRGTRLRCTGASGTTTTTTASTSSSSGPVSTGPASSSGSTSPASLPRTGNAGVIGSRATTMRLEPKLRSRWRANIPARTRVEVLAWDVASQDTTASYRRRYPKWTKVTYRGRTGYVASVRIDPVAGSAPTTSTSTSSTPTTSGTTAGASASGSAGYIVRAVNFRQYPRASSRKYLQIPRGARVRVLAWGVRTSERNARLRRRYPRWVKLVYSGRTGYVAAAFISRTPR